MSQSSWVAAYLSKCPVLLDELVNAQLSDTTFDWQVLAAILSDDLKVCGGDTGAQMDALRCFQHTQAPRLAVQDLVGLWTIEPLSDQLSALANTIFAVAEPCAQADMPEKHRDTPQFAIVGYGKLGGKELSYFFDLDLVYLYDDPHPDTGDVYSRLIRRLTNQLSAATDVDSLYGTGLCLRPNGDAGFLAYGIIAFEKYQHENAWTQRHQSLTRARSICGIPKIQTALGRTRTEILTVERDSTVLVGEIIKMYEKMSTARPPAGSNIRYARGDVVDVKFIIQYLTLAHTRKYPQPLDNYGNIALLSIAADYGPIDKTLAKQGRTACRFHRQQQYNTKLRDAKRTEVTDELLTHYGNVRKLRQEASGAEVKSG